MVATTRKPWPLHFSGVSMNKDTSFPWQQQGFQVIYVIWWRRKVSGCSLWVFCGSKTSIKTSMRWSVSFYLSSKQNWKFKHLVQTKPMRQDAITNIMKVSVAGTSLKESEKKVNESLCKKNNSQVAAESKDCKFRTYRQRHRPQRYKFP